MCQKCHSLDLTETIHFGVKVTPDAEGANVEVLSSAKDANELAFLVALAIKDIERTTGAPSSIVLVGVQSHLQLIDEGSLGGKLDDLRVG